MQERRGKYGEGIFFKFYNMGQIEMYSLFNTVTKVFLSLYLLISDYNYKKNVRAFFYVDAFTMNLWEEFMDSTQISIIYFFSFFIFIKFLIQYS